MKRPINFIMVDDEPAVIEHIKTIIKPFPYWKLRKSFTRPLDALKYLRYHHVDFVLLDMEMPEIDGKSMMLQIPPEIKIIIYTAHDQYAADAFDQDVVDFLRKPVSIERLNKAMARMARELHYVVEDGTLVKSDYFYFMLKGPTRNTRTKINLDELMYIVSGEENCTFYLVGDTNEDGEPARRYLCNQRLQDLKELLEGSQFVQIYRSLLLNKDYFESYKSGRVKIKGYSHELPAGSRKNYPDFFEWLDHSRLPNQLLL